jgi:hypothetical protein
MIIMRRLVNYREIINKRLLPKLDRMEIEIRALKEEWDIMKNPKLVRKLEESIKQKREGKLHGWEEFKEIVDEK